MQRTNRKESEEKSWSMTWVNLFYFFVVDIAVVFYRTIKEI